jgi:hypothetical protein
MGFDEIGSRELKRLILSDLDKTWVFLFYCTSNIDMRLICCDRSNVSGSGRLLVPTHLDSGQYMLQILNCFPPVLRILGSLRLRQRGFPVWNFV